MSTKVYTAQEDDSLHDVMALIRKYKIRHIPVLKGQNISGIISRSDLNRLTFGALFEEHDSSEEAVLDLLSVPQVMTAKPRTVSPHDSVRTVAEIFAKEEYHALPVIEQGELKGIVTTTDVIAFLLEHS